MNSSLVSFLQVVAIASMLGGLAAVSARADSAPSFTTNPVSQTALQGTNATFTVAVTGTGPFTYQWEGSTNGGRQWGPLTQGRIDTVTLQNVVTGQSGMLVRCVASDSAGTATSDAAILTVPAGQLEYSTPYQVQTLAGLPGVNVEPKPPSTDGVGTAASFSFVYQLTRDPHGNLFMLDSNLLRKMTPDFNVTTVGTLPGNPSSIVADGSGNVYFTDPSECVVEKRAFDGSISIFAGMPYLPGYADGGGSGSAALFANPTGLVLDPGGNLYVGDDDYVRKISPTGVVTTVPTVPGFQNVSGLVFDSALRLGVFADGEFSLEQSPGSAVYSNVLGGLTLNELAADSADNVYAIAGYSIERIDGNVATTVAGQTNVSGNSNGIGIAAATFGSLEGIVSDESGNLVVADNGNDVFRAISTSGQVTTIAGSTPAPFVPQDGVGAAASFGRLTGVAADSNSVIYAIDASGYLRKVTSNGQVTTLLAGLTSPPGGVAVDQGGTVYFMNGCAVEKLPPGGSPSVLAGSVATSGFVNGSGSTALFSNARGLAVDAHGNLFVTDTDNSCIREIAPDGTTSTYAGSPYGGQGWSDGPRLSALFVLPLSVSLDAAGNMYVAEFTSTAGHIRKITPAGQVSTLAGGAGGGNHFIDGQGLAATLYFPKAVSDANGDVFVVDYDCLRKVDPSGNVTTLAGGPLGVNFGNQDGVGSAAHFANPFSIAIMPSGQLVIADGYQLRVASNVAFSISQQPQSQAVSNGQTVSLSVGATASGLAYQWFFDGQIISGATGASWLFAASSATAGAYSVTVSDGATTLTSQVANVSITYVAPTFTLQPQSQTVIAGNSAAFTVGATGGGPLQFQWRFNGTAMAGATSTTLTVTASTATEGSYSATVSDGTTTLISQAAALDVTIPGHLINVSSRGFSGPGAQNLTVGLTVGGGARTALIRGVGPGLIPYGVTGTMIDPAISLYAQGASTPFASDDNWNGDLTLSAAFTATGAFNLPADSLDSALLATLTAGSYSARLTGANNTSGVVLLEAYDTAPNEPGGKFINLSGLGTVGYGANTITVGFVIGGQTPETVLIRAVGPTLQQFGLANAVSATSLALFAKDGTAIQSNAGWGGSPALAKVFAQVNAFALSASSQDSAIVVTLPPGQYTAIGTGPENAQGQMLLELYEVPAGN
ncbi:MAG TPA: hypothetical protein VGL42_16500 [Opitutaceae bacterium]